jgi:Na+/melibiose symporter-like transporter
VGYDEPKQTAMSTRLIISTAIVILLAAYVALSLYERSAKRTDAPGIADKILMIRRTRQFLKLAIIAGCVWQLLLASRT